MFWFFWFKIKRPLGRWVGQPGWPLGIASHAKVPWHVLGNSLGMCKATDVVGNCLARKGAILRFQDSKMDLQACFPRRNQIGFTWMGIAFLGLRLEIAVGNEFALCGAMRAKQAPRVRIQHARAQVPRANSKRLRANSALAPHEFGTQGFKFAHVLRKRFELGWNCVRIQHASTTAIQLRNFKISNLNFKHLNI